ncbi:hypothetical protein EJ05DRAFT_505524 [Pseudovirgaria hyperparasitica]|uniref:Uncharacterized protein n=1 Tax=Pseudovirgaria hyperparasitica TaxID=470096 RepID=A0A6A6VQU4_9PEZI|nr:uncharacterized protein EJ05DRAFT_505524 [Pseudovirgaria hyperparasitica]KAF2752972.1 hypothetical protein EJ05DRAFT_505524 [Pseudovirgaria hyperparasitica]
MAVRSPLLAAVLEFSPCLNQTLPEIPDETKRDKRPTRPSEPARRWEFSHRHAGSIYWRSKAEAAERRIELVPRRAPKEVSRFVGPKTGNAVTLSEADVSHYTFAFLTTPVIIFFEVALSLSENPKTVKLCPMHEFNLSSRSRIDMRLAFQERESSAIPSDDDDSDDDDSDDDNDSEEEGEEEASANRKTREDSLGLLELKKVGRIDVALFNAASHDARAVEVIGSEADIPPERLRQWPKEIKHPRYLRDPDTIHITQQCEKYSEDSPHCPIVVLFDWRTMIILEFKDVDAPIAESQSATHSLRKDRKANILPTPKITIIATEKGDEDNARKAKGAITFRQALLGVLVKCGEYYGIW